MASSILNYTSRLLPTFKKDRVLEDARIIETELTTNTIPSFRSSEGTFQAKDIVSKEVKDIQSKYFALVKQSNSKGMVSDIYMRLQAVQRVVETIQTVADKEFEASIVVDGITLYKASLIKTLELCGFISRYSLRLLNYIYVLETSAATKDTSYVSRQLSKGEIKELVLYFQDYCNAIRAISKSDKNYVKELEKLPNITVSSQSEATMANISNVKLDPLDIFSTTGFISPIYRLGMMFADFQVTRYKEAKELKTALELRKLHLENMRASGQADEHTQKEIEIVQSRIDRCSELIRREEEKVGM
jgi:hypothetical protein